MISIAFLGVVRVQRDGSAIGSFEADSARALLAYLALHAGSPQPRAQLAALLWPDLPESAARQNLRQAVQALARGFGPDADSLLSIAPASIQFNPAATVDVQQFRAALAQARSLAAAGQSAQALLDRLDEAVRLYRGDFLPGLAPKSSAFEAWAAAERAQLQGELLWALDRLAQDAEAAGRYDRLARYAQRRLGFDPACEEAHRQLMRAYAAQGQRIAALRQYQRCQQERQRAGGAPDAQTEQLYQELLTARLSPAAALPNNLPAEQTTLFGRSQQIAQLVALLNDPEERLVTLVGPGGTGKTRLALSAAAQLAGRTAPGDGTAFGDGVWFVALDTIYACDPDIEGRVILAIAAAVGLPLTGAQAPLDELAARLRDQTMLLVLDNIEQLLGDPGSLRVVERLIAAGRITLLITSRRRLDLPAERVLPVAGLPLPATPDPQALQSSSVRLFAERAGNGDGALAINAGLLPHVVDLCHFVEGLPLGIELAASAVRQAAGGALDHSLAAALDRWQQPLGAPPQRQPILRMVFDWSWQLLPAAAQQALAWLAIFQGGFTPAAALAVTGATLETLQLLEHAALLQPDLGDRYAFHAVVREYAVSLQEIVPAPPAVEQRYASWFADQLAQAESALRRPDGDLALAALRRDFADIRRAWIWAAHHRRTDLLERCLDGAELFLLLLGRPASAIEVLERTLDELPSSAEYAVLRARVQAAAAPLLRRTGQFERAQSYAQQSISLARHHGLPALQVRAMLQLSDVLLVHGQIQQARCEVEIALSLARRNAQRRLEAEAMLRLDFGLTQSDEYLQQALTRAQELGDCDLQSRSVSALGAYAIGTGQYGRARAAYEQALAYAERMENQPRVVSICNTLGDIIRLIGDYASAQAMYGRALVLAHRLGDAQIETHSLEGRSRLWLAQGQLDQALEDIRRCIGRCHQLKLTMVLAYALNSQGFIELALDNSAAAATCFEQSIAVSGRHQLDSVITESYAGLAAVALGRSRPSTALRYVTTVLDRITAGHLDYYADPIRVYLICHQSLAAAADPRAPAVLAAGIGLLRRQAATMQRAADQERFYAAAFNRDLLALAADQAADTQRPSR